MSHKRTTPPSPVKEDTRERTRIRTYLPTSSDDDVSPSISNSGSEYLPSSSSSSSSLDDDPPGTDEIPSDELSGSSHDESSQDESSQDEYEGTIFVPPATRTATRIAATRGIQRRHTSERDGDILDSQLERNMGHSSDRLTQARRWRIESTRSLSESEDEI